MRNNAIAQREALRDELQKLTDLVEQVVANLMLQEIESPALAALDRGWDDARRFLTGLPPKTDAEAEPTAEDHDQP